VIHYPLIISDHLNSFAKKGIMKKLREKFTCALIILLNIGGFGYVAFGKFTPLISQPEKQQQTTSESKEMRTKKQICAEAPEEYRKGFEKEWPQYVKNSRNHHETEAIAALRRYGEYRARWQEFIRQCKAEISGWQSPISQIIVEKAIREDCEGRIKDFLSFYQHPVPEDHKKHARQVIEECSNQITAGWEIPSKIRQQLGR
jgi:hypothetical protein